MLLPTAYAGVIGAPYAPTWRGVVRKAFEAINLGDSDTLIDLGAGDGRIVLEASRRGAKAIGIELSPIMWAIAWLRINFLPLTKGESRARRGVGVYFGNFYKQDISSATIIFAFLMPKNMPRLKKWLGEQQIPRGKYLLSYAFPMKDETPKEVVEVQGEGKIYIYDLQKLTRSDTKIS